MIGLRDENEALPPDSDDAPPAPLPVRAPELAAKLFGEGGILHVALSLEHRPQQARMAAAVADAVASDTPLVFEAGTAVSGRDLRSASLDRTPLAGTTSGMSSVVP